jgi:hypothetical protein
VIVAWRRLCVLAVAGSACFAQQALPASPKFALQVQPDPVLSVSVYGGNEPSGISPTRTPPARPTVARTANSKFFVLNGLQLGMAVFDVEMTQRCIADHRCREGNPLMPSSQAGQLCVNFALAAWSTATSFWLKKHLSKVWWIPPAAGTAVHGGGDGTGFLHQ